MNLGYRPKVLVFEWLCGGGMFVDRTDPEHAAGLLEQGRQMLSALCDDLRQANCDLIVPQDSRLNLQFVGRRVAVDAAEAVSATLKNLALEADRIIVIAPESGGRLVACLDWLSHHSRQLLNPGIAFTRLAADKNELQPYLAERGIPVPDGERMSCWLAGDEPRLSGPFVLKPSDGCGSEGLRLIKSPAEIDSLANVTAGEWRIEKFVEGTAASVSVISRLDSDPLLLPPLRQVFDDQPIGKFVRCQHDLPTEIAERATRLAHRTVATLPPATGWFGIDMVIGPQDVVIEVNPRMTMSYCQLRHILDFNPAARMLDGTQNRIPSAAFKKVPKT